jgi:hypothetical protein
MKAMRRVRQRNRSDCGVACVAMLARVSYQQAFDTFGFAEGERRFYTSRVQLVNALKLLGCEVQWRKFSSWEAVSGSAILGVNYRCNRCNFHWVAYDGKYVRDPSPKRPPRQRCFNRYRASGWYLLAVKKE